MNNRPRKKLGDLLTESGIISKEQLETALSLQKSTGKKLGEVLISEGMVTQEEIIQVLEFQLGIPHVVLEKYKIDQAACLLIPESLAKRYELIPIELQGGVLKVAMSDPLNVFAIDDVTIYSGKDVQPVIATSGEIIRAIDKYYGKQHALEAVEEFKKENESTFNIKIDNTSPEINEELQNSPAVKLVNSVIEQAIRNRASDIHIEPFSNSIKIRYRTDGEMYEAMKTEIGIMNAIATRIKIISGMNITEKRAPQDGRFSVKVDGSDYDLRVSILPTVFGEKIVMRVADKNAFVLSKDQLGFSKMDKRKFEKILKNPYGIVLVTGPTGSGKSTTLYTAVSEINKPNINIVTIEDPVECIIEDVNHVQVNNKSGLSFASGLRSILRQDPNVIMLGEIRDAETAQIAVRAAITGHLVLSTLHTNDAPGTVIRLVDMGVEPFLVASSLVGVIAQRLVRKTCNNCKEERWASEKELALLGVAEPLKLYHGRGCAICNGTGYKGRIGIYEIMMITKKHRELINSGCTEEELRDLSLKNKMKSLKYNAKALVLDGVTSIEEILKILFSNDN
ncbi:ATPase, T2SS/T4P/T4SS family [Herbivorax sp. ANBcel31]|uniref:GspE/PulE family protein n=1 Tax=Herbivorax sp. ANBcel31 TaxID=3069754 RepID=UPI0027ADCE87|nr:ATPase, T2SS/T4P/T4SS family [Herbivorax sp. ANBcel31]MDQ2085281.1 ATPase, T2SS/T4P/T4SS family [Herbivorax sp. ANBcel31]